MEFWVFGYSVHDAEFSFYSVLLVGLKQIRKLFFQMIVVFLAKLKGREKPFSGKVGSSAGCYQRK